MIRQLIKIDSELCNGCGLCVEACHEGAIGMVDGKAVLLRDDYCDGLGDCLPVCPTDAISFEKREALPCGCPSTNSRILLNIPQKEVATAKEEALKTSSPSQLRQWPIQLKLAPVNAPYFDGSDLLIAADCAAYASASFHNDFMKNRITLIGCPKLDGDDYSEKLKALFLQNDIHSITVIRMEVPCCGGLEQAVARALRESKKSIPLQVATLSVNGQVLS